MNTLGPRRHVLVYDIGGGTLDTSLLYSTGRPPPGPDAARTRRALRACRELVNLKSVGAEVRDIASRPCPRRGRVSVKEAPGGFRDVLGAGALFAEAWDVRVR